MRNLLRSLAALAALSATLLPALHAPRAAAAEKPNIIFILADDLGYGDLGCYGQKLIQTPNLDRMAAQGRRFTDHYSGSTVCAPSRATLMRGLHTGHLQTPGQGQHLATEETIIPEILKRQGYATAIIGKWGLAQEDEPLR